MSPMKHILTYLFIFILSMGYAQDDTRGSKAKAVQNSPEGTKRAVIIGVSDYNASELNLNYADNDAALFKNYLKDIEGVQDENISLFVNKNAVAHNIIKVLYQQLSQSEEGDILYIYFAGHGDVVPAR